MASRAIPTPTPAQFAVDYPEIAQGLNDQIKALMSGTQVPRRAKGGEAAILERSSRELDSRMEEQGWYPATVYNLMPLPIKVNGVLHNDIPCPECPTAAPYLAFTISRYQKDVRDRGNGVFVPEAWVPSQLAKDFVLESEMNKWGGVFWYRGEPIDPRSENAPAALKEAYEKARKGVLRWAREMFRVADAAWNSTNGDKRIVQEPHRKACMWLIDHGYLKEKDKPNWAEMTTEEVARMQRCPGCSNEAQPGAVKCSGCGYIYDPERAYKLGFIGPDNFALRRLTWDRILALKLNKKINKDELIESDEMVAGSTFGDEEFEEETDQNADTDFTPVSAPTAEPIKAGQVEGQRKKNENKNQQHGRRQAQSQTSSQQAAAEAGIE